MKFASIRAYGFLLAASVLLCSSFAFAADFKVAYVDMQKALASSSAGKDAQKKYEAEVKKLQAKLDDKKGEFEKLKSAYEKQKESLNDKAKQEKEEDLLSREKELKRTFQDSQEKLRRTNSQLVGELVEKLRKVVEEVGQAGGYTLILERGGQSVLFADSKIDITDSVVEKFDRLK